MAKTKSISLYCSNCGSKFTTEHAKFCSSCGEARVIEVSDLSLDDFDELQKLVDFIDAESAEELGSDDEVMYRRIVLKYPDGTIFFYGAGSGWYLSHLTIENSDSFLKNFSFPARKFKFTFEFRANGWKLTNDKPQVVKELIQFLDQNLGTAALALPIVGMAKSITSQQTLAEYLEGMGYETEEPEDFDEDRDEVVEKYKAYKELAKKKVQTHRKVVACSATDYISAYSEYGRFEKFFSTLKSEFGWEIDYNECCGNCAQQFRDSSDAESVFVTWGQYAENTWQTNGSVGHEYTTKSKREIKELETACETAGLKAQIKPDSKKGWFQILINAGS